VVALELCEERLAALRDKERDKLGSPLRSGLLPWLLTLLERAAGSLTDVFPGAEMLEAVKEAEKVEAQVVLIDRPIGLILQDLRSIPPAERVKIGIDILVALFTIAGKGRGRLPAAADLERLMRDFDTKYPTLSRILVTERDRYMADRLREILRSTAGKIVAVVGLGHVKGILQDLVRRDESSAREQLSLTYEWTL